MQEGLSLRPYTDADFPALQAALARWASEAGPCGYCHAGELAHRIYGEPRARPPGELVRVWADGAGVAGVAVTFRFGAAFDLFAAPALRGTPAELAMLEDAAAAIAVLVRAGPAGGDVVTDVYGCDTGRMAQLERLGFERYRVWDWITARELGEPPPAPQPPPGFGLRPARLDDAPQLALVRAEAFGAAWTAAGYRDGVMLRPGYRPERELVAVAPGGQLAGTVVLWTDELNGVGQIEPVGVRPAFRRIGLARALLLLGLAELRRLGMRSALIAHDATNLPALELYRGLGFARRDETVGYRKAAPTPCS
jgi:ribosomal protein S18 acetylase RimI-like enzyme